MKFGLERIKFSLSRQSTVCNIKQRFCLTYPFVYRSVDPDKFVELRKVVRALLAQYANGHLNTRDCTWIHATIVWRCRFVYLQGYTLQGIEEFNG